MRRQLLAATILSALALPAAAADSVLQWVEAGIPAAYALQSATLHAASVLGVEDQGVVEAGKRADIIAMPGDPLADIESVLKVDFVMKDGAVHREPAR